MAAPDRDGARTSEGWLALGNLAAGVGLIVAGVVMGQDTLTALGAGLLGINGAAYGVARSAVKRKAIEVRRPFDAVPPGGDS